MSDQPASSPQNPRNNIPPSRSDQELIADLQRQIAELKTAMSELQRSQDALEANREALETENRRLRREMTLANLIEDLEASIEDVVEDDGSVTVPPPAQRLYECLPATFLFPAFFRIADDERFDTAEARRYLVRYLADGLLIQSGAYLKKADSSG